MASTFLVTVQLSDTEFASLSAHAATAGYLPMKEATKWHGAVSIKPYKDKEGMVKLWGKDGNLFTAVLVNETKQLITLSSYN